MDDAALRADMIEGLEHRIGEPLEASVLAALQAVPREPFVDDGRDDGAGEDGRSRTLAPETVARMLAALDADEGDETLIVGAGVGYTAATLAEVVGARRVHAIDIDRRAVHLARSNLSDAGYDAVLVDRRDGANGLPEYAPYDRVLVEAAVVEPPRALREQLADDGRIVYPRGTGVQTIAAIEPASGDATADEANAGDDAPSPAAPSPPADDPEEDDAPAGFRTVETAGPARLQPMLADGERSGIERNRTRREDAEFAEQGYFARSGWERDWIDWDERL